MFKYPNQMTIPSSWFSQSNWVISDFFLLYKDLLA